MNINRHHKIFFLSAGQLTTKKERNPFNLNQLYLNYGLLSIASLLKSQGLLPIQFHGNFDAPVDFYAKLCEFGFNDNKNPVFISIPSFYAVSWCDELTKIIKKHTPSKKIVIGGRWVIDGESQLLKKYIQNVDIIIDGIAELKLLGLLGIDTKQYDKNFYPTLDYSILQDRKRYQPSFEVARGCGMKCNFCQERDIPLQSLKPPQQLIDEISLNLLDDQLTPMSPYFEASLFKPNERWVSEFTEIKQHYKFNFNWRTESRVDAITPQNIKQLSVSGLKVLDLGIESASGIQLKKMGKTHNPIKYLAKAELLLQSCAENNILTKINILLYSGENKQTIDETYKWLERNKPLISGISMGPVIAFGWDHKKHDFINELINDGATINQEKSLVGITHFDLSNQISYDQAIDISKDISCEFMSAENYYKLKSFSYFPRDYTYASFITDVKKSSSKLSFDVSKL